MRRLRRAALLPLALLGAACGRDAPPGPVTAPAEGLVVDAGWVQRAVADSTFALIFIGPDSAAFHGAAIPGARFLPLASVVRDIDDGVNELPPLDEVRASFEALGVSDSTLVVLYGEPLHAARGFVALDVLGHARTYLLDGGYPAWAAAGARTNVPARPVVPGRITSEPRTDIIVDADWVEANRLRRGMLVIDARPDAQYSGPESPGRIPGAGTLFWELTLVSRERPQLRPRQELHELFDAAGGEMATEIVVYCRTGMQASFLYFVARHLGYDVRLYDGSFVDWTARGFPVEQ